MNKFGDCLEKYYSIVAGIGMGSLLTCVFIDVLFREVFQSPILWLQEISMFSYMWLTFIGGAVAVRRNSHYKIDLLSNMIKNKKITTIITIIVLIISLIFAVLMAFQGIGFSQLGFKRVSQPSGIPLFVVFVSMPLSGLCMCYFIIERLLKVNS